jgi:LSD1 subclass zinc finger protein
MSTVRLRRLQSDYQRLHDYVTRHPRLQLVQAEGTPPEKYQIEFKVTSLRQREGQLQRVASHLVEIVLPRDYPRIPPVCRMLTPVFHPNIAPHAICIGDHWSAGESLPALVARIGEMLAYQSYNTKSPLNGEAAKWATENVAGLPLDAVAMGVEQASAMTSASPLPPGAAAAAAAVHRVPVEAPPPPRPAAERPPIAPVAAVAPPREVHCTECGARLRVPPGAARHIRCPKCRTVISIPTGA